MVDLVIKNEKDMFLLIKFLAYKINTVDGIRNSANFYIKGNLASKEESLIRYNLWKKTCFRYRVIIARNKISYSALKKC